ncbi:Lar family restriction alleviation protein [Aquamicrobium defluvii]|uniref:Restriction alleviation protein Lar n=1 Tax=Aquamicrobium defluvii TaxID=69279 RepID=A0A011UTZ3_9HYPH|nr:Lar family restriction alleviation protein [Aquamicrobium defluvii]EXL09731.1 hypothetical protein BG36_21045 [Aquamicrobium defluvii]EZQ16485.1 hypothetical protein CF98_40675 [Halopseudomonas bauzanensis]
MADLLSCPFCGKAAQIAPDEIGSGGQHVPPYHAGCFRGAGCGIAFTADDPDEAIEEWNRRALTSTTPPDELSGDPGELIDKMAEAIRDWGSHYDDGPWETLPEDRKAGWRGDAERALAVVKEYLTSQAATALRLSAGGGVPEGWKLVPVEPTPEMIGAFWRQKNCGTQGVGERGPQTDDYSAYRAMLDASPAAEVGHVE